MQWELLDVDDEVARDPETLSGVLCCWEPVRRQSVEGTSGILCQIGDPFRHRLP